MSLVRIISRLSEYPTELVRDLRSKGFEVETVLSGNERQEAADLEITIDQCSAENISESVCDALAKKDVVIFADSQATGRKIRSIGMVLLSPEANLQTDRKTAVPEQLREIYTSLLHGRLDSGKSVSNVNSSGWNLAWVNRTWMQCYAVGKNFTQISARVVTETVIWVKSRKISWPAAATPKVAKAIEPEPDLVPSMFSLSAEAEEASELKVAPLVVMQPAARTIHLWKVVVLGSVGVLAVTLLLHGFSHTSSKANQGTDKNETSVQAQAPVPVPEPQKAIAVTTKLVKSHAEEDENFQEVVVRHFTQPAPNALPKDKIKRRVVVD